MSRPESRSASGSAGRFRRPLNLPDGTAAGRRAGIRADISDWKDGVNRLRTVTYADLLKIATEKG